jgi:hypothetical protein
VAQEGRSFGGKAKSADGVPPALCIQLLREVVAEALAGAGSPIPFADSQPPNCSAVADAARGALEPGGGADAGATVPSAPVVDAEAAGGDGPAGPDPEIDGFGSLEIAKGTAPEIAVNVTAGIGEASHCGAGAGFAPGFEGCTASGTNGITAPIQIRNPNVAAKTDQADATGIDGGAVRNGDEGSISREDRAPPPLAFLLLAEVMRSDGATGALAGGAGSVAGASSAAAGGGVRGGAGECGDGVLGAGGKNGGGRAAGGSAVAGDGGDVQLGRNVDLEAPSLSTVQGGRNADEGMASVFTVLGEPNIGVELASLSAATAHQPPVPLRSGRSGSAGCGGSGIGAPPPAWKWREDVTAYYAAVGGMERLQRPRPSTGYFGNGDVAAAMRSLSDSRGGCRCRVLPLAGRPLGKGVAGVDGYIRVSHTDGEEEVGRQWRELQVRQRLVRVYHTACSPRLYCAYRRAWRARLPPSPTPLITCKPIGLVSLPHASTYVRVHAGRALE